MTWEQMKTENYGNDEISIQIILLIIDPLKVYAFPSLVPFQRSFISSLIFVTLFSTFIRVLYHNM